MASGQKEQSQGTRHKPLTTELRAAIFIGPEFGTVSRPDLVAAAREAGNADFDVLIACAFIYSEFDKLGRICLIVHETDASLLLCYINHYDNAYRRAERRKLETHPRTGAAQLVETRETVQDIIVPAYVTAAQTAPPKARLSEHVAEDTLLQFADTYRARPPRPCWNWPPAASDKSRNPRPLASILSSTPMPKRRFRFMTKLEELARGLDYPWEKWTIFLHPAQRQWVEGNDSGPPRVSGSAGTGKIIVALHRAVFLARTHPDARVLLTTFSNTLAHALRLD